MVHRCTCMGMLPYESGGGLATTAMQERSVGFIDVVRTFLPGAATVPDSRNGLGDCRPADSSHHSLASSSGQGSPDRREGSVDPFHSGSAHPGAQRGCARDHHCQTHSRPHHRYCQQCPAAARAEALTELRGARSKLDEIITEMEREAEQIRAGEINRLE